MSQPSKIAVFTIASNNYSAHANVLLRSLAKHQPAWDRWFLLVDKPVVPALVPPELAKTHLAVDLPLPGSDTFFIRYDILEANTAVKPWMIEYLFDCGYEWVVYLDPDIKLYSGMEELESQFATSSVVLTPHITQAYSDKYLPDELQIKRTGVFNLGFGAFRNDPEGRSLVKWWQGHLAENCINALHKGIFVDQSWMNMAPAYCSKLALLKHPGYNTAYWNLHYRNIGQSREGAFSVNGLPLRFFHFSGFSYKTPNSLSKHQNRFAPNSLDGNLQAVLNDYAKCLLAEGVGQIEKNKYQLSDELVNSRLVASIFQSPQYAPIFRSPESTPTKAEWLDFLQTPSVENTRLPFFLYSVWRSREDLQRHFDISTDSGVFEFSKWFDSCGRRECGLSVEIPAFGWWTPTADRSDKAVITSEEKPVLTIYGYTQAESGMGESVRASIRAAKKLGIPHRIIDFSVGNAGSKRKSSFRLALPSARASIDLIHVNFDQMRVFEANHPECFGENRYRIGFWAWEQDVLPETYFDVAPLVHEIWAPSAVNADVYRRHFLGPVRSVWHNVDVTEVSDVAEVMAAAGVLPGERYFLAMADFLSFPERKGPLRAVQAYLRAFPQQVPGVVLVVKCLNIRADAAFMAKLMSIVQGRGDVRIFTKSLTRAELNALMKGALAFISMHANEGFGLPIAECISLGTPVVCTGYGGNVDYCNTGNSYLARYSLVELDSDIGPYKKGTRWAAPDLDDAATAIRACSSASGHPVSDRDYIIKGSFAMYAAAFDAVMAGYGKFIESCRNPSVVSSPSGTKFSIDRLVNRGNHLALCGWLSVPIQTSVSDSLELVLTSEGSRFAFPVRRTPRPDVAAHFSDLSMINCGFDVTVELPYSVRGNFAMSLRLNASSRIIDVSLGRELVLV